MLAGSWRLFDRVSPAVDICTTVGGGVPAAVFNWNVAGLRPAAICRLGTEFDIVSGEAKVCWA